MAEKPSELNDPNSIDKLDPLAVNAGAGTDPFVEKYVDDDLGTAESREMLTNTGEHPEETEQIKARIEETRKEMGETIDAIQERLSFSNVSEQVSEHVNNVIESAKDSIYDATVGKAVGFMKNAGDGITNSNMAHTVRSNPFPLLLIGLGAGLLAYQSYSGKSRKFAGRRNLSGGYDSERRSLSGAAYQNQERRSGSTLGSARKAVGDMTGKAYDTVANTANSALGTVSSAAGSAYDGVTGTVNEAYSTAEDVMHRGYERAGELAHDVHEKYDYYLEENPLAIGAVALGLGAAIGFAIPSTHYEGKLMGEARENLMQKATEAAGGLVDKAKHVADEAGRTIKDEAQQALEG